MDDLRTEPYPRVGWLASSDSCLHYGIDDDMTSVPNILRTLSPDCMDMFVWAAGDLPYICKAPMPKHFLIERGIQNVFDPSVRSSL